MVTGILWKLQRSDDDCSIGVYVNRLLCLSCSCLLRWTWLKTMGLWSTSTTPKCRRLCLQIPSPSQATLRPSSWRRCSRGSSVSWGPTASAACANWPNSSLGKVGGPWTPHACGVLSGRGRVWYPQRLSRFISCCWKEEKEKPVLSMSVLTTLDVY